MLKRSAFKSKAPAREARDPDRIRPTPTVTPGAFRAPLPVVSGDAVPKTVAHRNPALLAMAWRQPCMLRVEGVCNNAWETTVAAHSNSSQHGKSGARKADDQYHVYACFACHCWLDSGPAHVEVKRAAFERAHAWMVEIWRQIAAGMQRATPKERAAAQWALDLLENAGKEGFDQR